MLPMAKRERRPPRRNKAQPAKGRPDDDRVAQVGRRPSPPALLFVIAIAWIACGIVALVALSVSWKLVPGIVFIGIGILYLRAALTTVARRGES